MPHSPEKLIALSEKKGATDADLYVFDSLQEVEEKVVELENDVATIKDEIDKNPQEDVRVEKIAMRLAAKLATLEKGDDGHTPTEEGQSNGVVR